MLKVWYLLEVEHGLPVVPLYLNGIVTLVALDKVPAPYFVQHTAFGWPTSSIGDRGDTYRRLRIIQ